jgi:serine/threonine-protein kinase HipA
VHTILGRHFKQTADACGLPAGTFKTIVEEIGDTGKAKIDQTLSKLPPDFPATVVGSISDGAKRRIDTLASA